MPIELDTQQSEVLNTPSTRASRPGSGKLRLRERSSFFERLSLMLDAGTSLHTALESMQRTEDPQGALGGIIGKLKKDINNGLSFADALSKHPQLLSEMQLKLIGAGEQGGFLSEVIKKIVEFETRQHTLRNSLMAALTYPAVLLFISVAVCLFVLIAVFPKFKDMFVSLGDQLPFVSQLMFALSNQLIDNGAVAYPVILVSIFLIVQWVRSEIGRTALRTLIFKIPYTQAMYVNYAIAQMTRALALSLEHGVSVSDALVHLKGSFANTEIGATLDTVEELVDSGQGLSAGFNRSPHIPDLVKQLVSAGEESGSLAQVFDKLATHYETEISRQVNMLGKIAEPLMLLVMGVMIGGMVSALILPIFQLSSTIG